MQDIVFINPPNHCREDYISLGLQNLYSIIKDSGYHTRFIDLQKHFITGDLKFGKDCRNKIERIVDFEKAKIYAFTVWNTSFPWVIHICRYVKSINPKAVILIGGPLSTLASEQILTDYDCIDIACRFEGEPVIKPLIDALLAGGLPSLAETVEAIPNITFRGSNGGIVSTPDAALIDDLDTLPMIETAPENFNSRVINIEAGRGCSFHCTYCSSCFIWKFKPRYKSGFRLFSEIEKICAGYKEAGIDQPVFHLEHDNFLMKQEVLVELDQLIKERGLAFKYGFAGRADLITDRNLELLKRTGCVYVYLGIETGSSRMQKITRKNLSFDTVFSAIRKIQEKGIMVNANVMYGFPEETLADLHETLDFINTLRHLGVTVHISMLSPELKTPVGETAPLSDYLFNASSPYVGELIKSGFKPEDYGKVYLNHLYALKNRHYDLLLYNGFVQFWHALVSDYPVTVHLLLQKSASGWDHRFAVWKDRISPRSLSEFTEGEIPDLFGWFDAAMDGDAQERETLLTESRLAGRSGSDSKASGLPEAQLRNYYRRCHRLRKETLVRLGLQP